MRVYKKNGANYEIEWEYDQKINFAHAICAADIHGQRYAVVGHRKDARDLLLIQCCNGQYQVELLDHDVGPANVLHSVVEGTDVLLAANREINEVAYYTLREM